MVAGQIVKWIKRYIWTIVLEYELKKCIFGRPMEYFSDTKHWLTVRSICSAAYILIIYRIWLHENRTIWSPPAVCFSPVSYNVTLYTLGEQLEFFYRQQKLKQGQFKGNIDQGHD